MVAMTPIDCKPIDRKMAWRGSDISSKDAIAFDLTRSHVAALEDVLLRVRNAGLPLQEIGPEHCRHPALDAGLARVFDEIQDGRGIVIVRGLPVEGYSVEDVSTMFWAVGAHLGRGVSQSALGDVLGQVKDETPPGQAESARGYTSRRELSLHVDLAQIVGLMCVRQARSGGYSQYRLGPGDLQRDPRHAAGPDAGPPPRLSRTIAAAKRRQPRRRSRHTISRCSANAAARSACSSSARSSTPRSAT